MIVLLCPSRRPDGLHRMVESVLATRQENTLIYTEDFPEFMPTVHKWNKLAKNAMAKYPEAKLFMLAADDIIFETKGWDKAILDHYNTLENKIHVYALQDSRDNEGTPHPFITREWIREIGYFIPPYFLHWFCDSWVTDIARANTCFTHLKNYKLIHDKPSDKGQPDETHLGIRRMGWHDRDKYVNDTCQHFLEFEKSRLGAIIDMQKRSHL